MFIRRTQTRNRVSGEPYTTYRLVQTARVGGAVKQSTLLNLGSHLRICPKLSGLSLPSASMSCCVASAPCSTQRCRTRARRWRLAMRRN